jgi:NO-binding membrane sensor protein with MHYT domain
MVQVPVHNFSHGLLNPGLGYLMSCLGSFLGLRCLTRARAYTGWTRATWLMIAAVAIGATGIWVVHFVAFGLVIVGYGGDGRQPVLTGGVIIGIGVASMHYLGMAAMSMRDSLHYNIGLVAVSVLIAIVAGTAALAAGRRVRGVWSTAGVSLIMGAAVTGMHYTGMAAVRVYAGGGQLLMSGEPPQSLVFPLLLGASALTFLLGVTIAVSPNEQEILADAALTARIYAAADA